MDDLGVATGASVAGRSLLVGRQPLLERSGQLAGYEIRVSGGETVGVEALLAATADLGRRRSDGSHILLIEGEPELLDRSALELVRAHRIWLGVGSRLVADPAATEALRAVARDVPLVVDDPATDPALAPLAEAATVLRVRSGAHPDATLAATVARLRSPGQRVLVTDVDTPEDRHRALAAGADLSQGSVLMTAERLHGARVSPDAPGLVRLMSLVDSDDAELHEIIALVKANVTLSFQLLRLANSAAVGTRMPVDSVDRAVQLLGPPTLRQLAPLLLMRTGRQVPEELTRTAMVRARMCQHLGAACGDPRPVHHTVGMLSTMDAIVGLPLADVVAELPVTDEVRGALLRREGVAGRILAAVESYERFEWESPVVTELDPVVLADAYFRAVRDADAILARFVDAVGEALTTEPDRDPVRR